MEEEEVARYTERSPKHTMMATQNPVDSFRKEILGAYPPPPTPILFSTSHPHHLLQLPAPCHSSTSPLPSSPPAPLHLPMALRAEYKLCTLSVYSQVLWSPYVFSLHAKYCYGSSGEAPILSDTRYYYRPNPFKI